MTKTFETRPSATAKVASSPKLPLKAFSDSDRQKLEQWLIFRIQSTGLDVSNWEQNVILQLAAICRAERELVHDVLSDF